MIISHLSQRQLQKNFEEISYIKNRMILIKNILPEQLIKRQAESFSVEKEMNASGIKILSIGRFCYAKNFDNVPDICRQIRQNGLEVTWYLIGFGKMKSKSVKEYVRQE